MANRTDPTARAIHGTNPQNLIEAIVRNRIYSNLYWKETCFGLTAESLVDKAMLLTDFGGQYGGNRKPTKFLCLTQKMLQLQPEKEIIIEFIKNEDYKYVRLLGAFYLRLVGSPKDIYQYLEPLYNDYRRIRRKTDLGYEIIHVDEFIDELLTKDHACDITLPFLPKRSVVEEQDDLPPRVSVLEADLLEEEEAEKRRIEEEAAKLEKEKEKAAWKMSRKEKQEAESARGRRDDRDDFGASEDRSRRAWRDDKGDKERDSVHISSRSERDDRDRRDRDRYDDRGRGSGDRDRDRDRGSGRSDRDRRDDRDRRPEERGKEKEKEKDGALPIEEMNKLREQLGLKPLAKK